MLRPLTPPCMPFGTRRFNSKLNMYLLVVIEHTGDVKKAQTAKKRNCRTKADINGQENKTVGSQAFSCLKLYAFLL